MSLYFFSSFGPLASLSRQFTPAYQALWEASCLSILNPCHRGNKNSCGNKHQALSLLGYDRLSNSLGYGISPGLHVTASSWRHKQVSGQALSIFLTLCWPLSNPWSWERANFSFTSPEMLSRCIELVQLPDPPLERDLLSIVHRVPRLSPLYDKCEILRTPGQLPQLILNCFNSFFLMWETKYYFDILLLHFFCYKILYLPQMGTIYEFCYLEILYSNKIGNNIKILVP